MVSTGQLLLSLLISGVFVTTLANERQKRSPQDLQSILSGLFTPPSGNPLLPPWLGLPTLNPPVSVSPQPSQTPSTNSPLAAGVVAASEESGEGSRQSRKHKYVLHQKPGKGPLEHHSTGSHSAEDKGNSHKPHYGHTYPGSHSSEGKGYPGSPGVHYGHIGSHPGHGCHSKPAHHKPHTNINIHYKKGPNSHGPHSSSESSGSSSSSSSDEKKGHYKHRKIGHQSDSSSAESKHSGHHDSSSSSSD